MKGKIFKIIKIVLIIACICNLTAIAIGFINHMSIKDKNYVFIISNVILNILELIFLCININKNSKLIDIILIIIIIVFIVQIILGFNIIAYINMYEEHGGYFFNGLPEPDSYMMIDNYNIYGLKILPY